jgi:hypothetical protein
MIPSSCFISPGINLSHHIRAWGRVPLVSALMSGRKCAFAFFLLPKCCKFEAQAEPKRNIIRAF